MHSAGGGGRRSNSETAARNGAIGVVESEAGMRVGSDAQDGGWVVAESQPDHNVSSTSRKSSGKVWSLRQHYWIGTAVKKKGEVR